MESRPLNAVHLHRIMGRAALRTRRACRCAPPWGFKLHAGVQIKGSRERAVAGGRPRASPVDYAAFTPKAAEQSGAPPYKVNV